MNLPAEASSDRRVADAAVGLATVLATATGARGLGRARMRELPARYRQAVTALAQARARGVPTAELEALVLRAHALLYAPEPIHLVRALRDVLVALPLAARRVGRPALLAAAILVAGGAWGGLEVHRDPTAAAVLLSRALQVNAESFQKGFAPRGGDPLYGAFYFTNNARAALTAFALGATFGVGTVLVLLYNGVVLGATVAIVAAHGSLAALFSYVLPHAGVELTAIVLAAAAGFRLADALLRPGWAGRLDALARAARETLPLAVGSAALLVVAGITEGWIAPLAWPLAAKAAVGAALDLGLVLYLAWPARAQSAEGVAT